MSISTKDPVEAVGVRRDERFPAAEFRQTPQQGQVAALRLLDGLRAARAFVRGLGVGERATDRDRVQRHSQLASQAGGLTDRSGLGIAGASGRR